MHDAKFLRSITVAVLVLGSVALAGPAAAETKLNAACPTETAFYDPGTGQDIAVPEGYKVEVFAKGLNFPTGLAFLGGEHDFKVLVVESGTGLPSDCNNNARPPYSKFTNDNPFTPDLLVFDKNGKKIAGPLFKPTPTGGGYQSEGPALGLAFEHGTQGGTLFATDSNQGIRGARGSGNNTSRVLTLDLKNGVVHPYIKGLPTGDHPTELIVVKDGYIYWSQGSATNAGVTGHDNGAGGNQHDIACQDIKLSDHVFDSGDGHFTSGYSNHGVARPNTVVRAFESATEPGMCTGAILRARITSGHPKVEPVSWGYRNPFGLRFAPADHALKGGLFITENGEDERGARPVGNAPDRLAVARMNPDGTPDYHGWPDRFGSLDSTQFVFNPKGGPADDLCSPDPAHPGNATTFPACAAVVVAEDVPVRPVFDHFPQPPVGPIALEPADVAIVGPDFAPDSFVHGVVHKGAVLAAREGDLGFAPGNGEPEEGHDIQLVNFSKPGEPLRVIGLERFAFNCAKADQYHKPGGHAACHKPRDQAFTEQIHGINRPLQNLFGPDGALYLVDYGAVRDVGRSDPRSKYATAADGPLPQIPGTGTIFKITRIGSNREGDDDDDD
jgi:glucose/arabinose dehydrogenase